MVLLADDDGQAELAAAGDLALRVAQDVGERCV
jgi:hypothetical protein